jgi:hypothetical protein
MGSASPVTAEGVAAKNDGGALDPEWWKAKIFGRYALNLL